MDSINLYNHFHYGDLFFSRCLIKGLSEKFKINFYHKFENKIFYDLENVNEISGLPDHFNLGSSDGMINGNINTWMSVDGGIYILKEGRVRCSFIGYMEYIKKVLNHFNIPIRDYEYYYPEILSENLENKEYLDESFDNLKTKFESIVLICTGKVCSGQAENFEFNPIIDLLSSEFPDILFLVTSDDINLKNNVISTTNLFPSLLDISYISSKINLIVGRASGPYGYCLTKNNLNDKNKTFICFCDCIEHSIFFEVYNCNLIWSNNYEQNHVIVSIRNELLKIK
jgi:hypothetical protein